MNENLIFRSPTESDIQDIMEIARTTWNGHDHLPEMFDVWLHDASCHPAAIEIDGKLIALGNVRIIENGATGWLEGLRVHHAYRNKGLARLMTRHLLDITKELGAKRTRLTLSGDNPAPIRLAESIGMIPLLNLDVSWYVTPDELEFGNEAFVVGEISGSELIKRDLQKRQLLPSNVVIYYWYAVDYNPEAVLDLDSKTRFWISEADNEIKAICFGLKHSTASESEWCSTIYAGDEDAFLSLIASQVTVARESGCTTMMILNMPEHTNCLRSFQSLGECIHELNLVLYEGIVD